MSDKMQNESGQFNYIELRKTIDEGQMYQIILVKIANALKCLKKDQR